MDIFFLCLVAFLFLLAIFNLSVGVSNDAVNFLNSAIGSRSATFKQIIIIASIGVFIGAAMSNGMMEIARHGIFRPEQFSFYELMCIFMAVMVANIILLDIFNTLGMPTSTTVSMVFELLGASFAVSVIKISAGGSELGFSDLLNTDKALSVIIGIFLSVAIAFIFGVVVQFLTRTLFSFNYRCRLTWKVGLFGGLCATAIVYFLLIKGLKDLTFMTPELKSWIGEHTLFVMSGCFVGFTLLMQLLHTFRVNVLKVIVLMGTFALAMAFAGNDLVNFIGVPLAGYSACNDFMSHGGGDAGAFMMDSLNGPADTSVWFLIAAGLIMVVSLATSKKARKVSQTEIGLGSQAGGDEMFGSSRIARHLVRWTISLADNVRDITPTGVRQWFIRRFNTEEVIMEQGASFDLIRASVNLVLAGMLIALGTSLHLPLSTTFVSFMVAMGTSLADGAWGRESAVFRITGVISVIGGWFLTAGAAFIGAGLLVLAMYYGGIWMMVALSVLTIFLVVRSHLRFREKETEEQGDVLFQTLLSTHDSEQVQSLFLMYLTERQKHFLVLVERSFSEVMPAFVKEDLSTLNRNEKLLQQAKIQLKNDRRKETLCLRLLSRETAIEKSTWFYLGNNCCMSILYNLRRITEICREHVENNFQPFPERYLDEYEQIRIQVSGMFLDTIAVADTSDLTVVTRLRHRCIEVNNLISDTYHLLYERIREDNASDMTVLYVYLNLLQETHEMLSSMHKFLRAFAKMRDNNYSGRG